MSASGTPPRIALIVVSHDGAHHLPACLDSIAALDYPADLLETIVVDNGSTDGSLELLRDRFPWARVLAQPSNLGFAEAVNVAARSTAAECLALANNDMRLDAGWLRELVGAYEPADGVSCVGGVILDWDGKRAQFVGGIVNFHGAGAQVGFDIPLAQVDVQDGRELPFACGGSMLVGRERFLELGGFDERFFAYFEDVDFGWRLRLAGDTIRLAADARCFHRHHATGATIPLAERQRLYERNWLLTLLKNLDDPNLGRVLSAALLLLVKRAALDAERRPDEALARLHAVSDVVRDVEAIMDDRRRVQTLRRRSDADVFRQFGRPFFPASDDPEYLAAMVSVTEALGLGELFSERSATRLLVVPGNDERLRAIGLAAARLLPTTVAAPGTDAETLRQLVAESDLVLVDGREHAATELADEVRGLLVVDVHGGSPLPSLVAEADVITVDSEEGLRRFDGSGKPVLVLTPGSPEQLRSLVQEPWRWQRPARSAPLEPALIDRARRRRELGAPGSRHWQFARAVWRRLPERLRTRLRS